LEKFTNSKLWLCLQINRVVESTILIKYEWGEQADPKDKFVSYASAIGLNVDQFKKDYDGEAGKAGIERDKALGTSISLKGTPSFFINGVAFDTTGGGEELLKQIDALVQQ
jgi:protein-disulfide isomerase